MAVTVKATAPRHWLEAVLANTGAAGHAEKVGEVRNVTGVALLVVVEQPSALVTLVTVSVPAPGAGIVRVTMPMLTAPLAVCEAPPLMSYITLALPLYGERFLYQAILLSRAETDKTSKSPSPSRSTTYTN